jgi:hypothetical protein
MPACRWTRRTAPSPTTEHRPESGAARRVRSAGRGYTQDMYIGLGTLLIIIILVILLT